MPRRHVALGWFPLHAGAVAMNEEADDYFSKGCGRCGRFATPDCSARKWATGLAELRRVCLESGLAETVRWGHPTYACGERNVAIIGAFRDDFRLSFFNAALMRDPGRVLEKPGPNTRHSAMIRFTADARVAELEPLLRSYLAEARSYAEAGITAPKDPVEPELPEEMVEALDSDPELADAFRRLTPGRRRSYVINLNSAKTSATRTSRIAKFRDRILAGKGATER
jgi:uncharacterized protein YdeI (YjbR/CyaY-like superfamily)